MAIEPEATDLSAFGYCGAQANHAKKQTKNAIQVRWKARICGKQEAPKRNNRANEALDKSVQQPVDRDEWSMTPQTVNASYSPALNAITIPAAILQPPFTWLTRFSSPCLPRTQIGRAHV